MTIFQVTHLQRLHGQELRNIFYYATSVGDPTDSEWQDIVDEIRADYVANMTGQLVTEFSFYGIDHRVVDTAGLLSFREVPTAGSWSGTATGESTASQIALLVSVKGTTTKPNRARTYLGGNPGSGLLNSEWLLPFRDNAVLFIEAQRFLNSAGTNPLNRVAAQWNSTHTQVIVTNDISSAPVVASLVPATQRRRRLGVGI